MAVQINGETYYRMAETCKLAELSRATLVRWLGKGLLTQIRRDRRGWRLFSKDDIEIIRAEAIKIHFESLTSR